MRQEKKLREKEKMLVTSMFSLSYITSQKASLSWSWNTELLGKRFQWHPTSCPRKLQKHCVFIHFNPFPHNDAFLTPLGNKPFENTEGKGEIAHYEQFLLFPQCFLPIWITLCHCHQFWNCCLQTLSVWKSLKFVVWERVKTLFSTPPFQKGLKHFHS